MSSITPPDHPHMVREIILSSHEAQNDDEPILDQLFSTDVTVFVNLSTPNSGCSAGWTDVSTWAILNSTTPREKIILFSSKE